MAEEHADTKYTDLETQKTDDAQEVALKTNTDGGSTTNTTEAKLSKTLSQDMLATAAGNVEDDSLRPFAFAKFIVTCPCLLCLIVLVILIIFTAIFGALFELTLTNSRTGFPDPPDQYITDFDGYSLATDFVQFEEEEEVNAITQSEEIGLWQYLMFFELKDYKNDLDLKNPEKTNYWILTPENIKTIIQYEDKIFYDKEWNDRFCWVGDDPFDSNYTCQFNKGFEDAVISPARVIAEFYDYDYESFTTEDVKNFTMAFLSDKKYCFNPGAFETGQIWIYRSFFRAGAPIGNGEVEWENKTRVHLTDYKNAEDQLDLGGITGQTGVYYTWGLKLYEETMIANDGAVTEGDLNIMLYNPSVHMNYLFAALANSVVFLILAILSVCGYMSYHLGSIFLASGAMFGILMSFPSAYFVYRVIFQVPIFDILSTLIVFVLLGVGADDVFVFTDAWTQSVHFVGNVQESDDVKTNCCGCDNKEEQRDIKRMSFTFRRAALAMLVTQITTFFAFLATATSILINMSAFGIWAACVVMMNYFLVITLYPAILMLHHKYIKKYERACLCFCCNLCSKKEKQKESDSRPTIKPQLSRQSSILEVAEEYGKAEKFLGTKYAVFIVKYKWYILIFFLILMIFASIGFSQIKTATQTDNAFEDDHWYIISQNQLRKFTASETDSLVPSHITFGIKGVNKDGVEKYRPDDYYGKIIWDNNFEIASIEQQLYLKFLCNSLKNQTNSNLVYSAETVNCPIEDFENYLSNKTNYSFPYEYKGNDMTQTQAFNKEWAKFLESSYGLTSMMDALTYNEHDTVTDTYDIKYYAMWFYTTLVSEGFTIDGAKFEAYLQDLEKYIDSVTGSSSNCPDNLCDSVGNPNILWVFLSIINGYISSAVKGILIALPLAFIVMLFSTGNWIIALFALLDILGVMLCELSIMFLLGYEFSLTESIATVIIIGFSVDYVVHLANAYLESGAKTRDQRLSFALLTIGISVTSGAITTFSCGFFLIFAEFIFFKKMGSILMTTVLMSIIWAMCFFTALCAAFGPQGETGDLRKYFKMIWTKCKPQKNDIENKNEQQMELAIR